MTIRPLGPRDVEQVSRIHLEELPQDFCALLGPKFLSRVFYSELFKVSEVKLGIVDDRDDVCGFAVFSTDAGFLRRLIARRFLWLPAVVDWRALVRPSFWSYLLEVMILLFTRDARLQGAELVYFAVSRNRRVGWLSFELIARGLAQLRESAIESCWLKTLESTPLVVRFYEMAGFQRLKLHLGRVYMVADTRTSAGVS